MPSKRPKSPLGKALRARRLQRKLTQAELAKALGYGDGATISRIERGHRPDPKLPVLRRIATVLGTTVATLLKGE